MRKQAGCRTGDRSPASIQGIRCWKGAILLAIVANGVLRLPPTVAAQETSTLSTPQAPPDTDSDSRSPDGDRVEESPVRTWVLRDKHGNYVQMPIDMTYEEWESLYRLSRLKQSASPDRPPAFVLQEFSLSGHVSNGLAVLKATFQVRLEEEGWVRIPLRMHQAVLTQSIPSGSSSGAASSSKAPGASAKDFILESQGDGEGFVCWLRGEKGATRQITLPLAVPLTSASSSPAEHARHGIRDGDSSSLRLTPPRATSSRLEIEVPVAPLQAKVSEGSILASVKPVGKDRTKLTVLKLGGQLDLSWRQGEAEALPPASQFLVLGAVQVNISGRRRLRCDARLLIDSFGAPVEEFLVLLPPGMQLSPLRQVRYQATPLTAAEARKRKLPRRIIDKAERSELLRVRLTRPSMKRVEIRLLAESTATLASKPPDQTPTGLNGASSGPRPPIETAGFEVLGAAMQYGHVHFVEEGDWSVQWIASPAVVRAELTEKMIQQGISARFEYHRQPFSLKVDVRPKVRQVRIEPTYRVYVQQDRVWLEGKLACTARGAKVYNVELDMAGWRMDRAGPDELVALNATPFRLPPRLPPETSSGEASSGETSSGETSSGETSSGEASSGEASSGEASSGEASSGETSSGETSSGETSSGETSSGETSSGETSSGASSRVILPLKTPQAGSFEVHIRAYQNIADIRGNSNVDTKPAAKPAEEFGPSAPKAAGEEPPGPAPLEKNSVLPGSLIKFSLPRPAATIESAAWLSVFSSDEVKLTPKPKSMTGLGPDAAVDPRDLSARFLFSDPIPFRYDLQQTPLAYRSDAGQAWSLAAQGATFAAQMEIRPQALQLRIAGQAVFSQNHVEVVQSWRLNVAHQPLQTLTFLAPRAAWVEKNFTIHEGAAELLPSLVNEVRPGDASSPNIDPFVALKIRFRRPHWEPFQLTLRYRLPLPELPVDQEVAFALPIATLDEQSAIDDFRHVMQLVSRPSLVVNMAANQSSWTLEKNAFSPQDKSEFPPLEAVKWAGPSVLLRASTDSPLQQAPLLLTRLETAQRQAFQVERAWLQTWFTPAGRRDRAVFLLSADDSPEPEVQIQLPEGVDRNRLEVAVDGARRPQAAFSNTGEVRIPLVSWAAKNTAAGPPRQSSPRAPSGLPLSGAGRQYVIELWYSFDQPRPPAGLLVSAQVQPPEIMRAAPARQFYWQLITPDNEHLVIAPVAMTPEMHWGWSGFGWRRRPRWTQRDLQQWTGASIQDDIPDAANQYLFSDVTLAKILVFRTARRRDLVLVFSSTALLAGLLLIYAPALRRPGALFVIGVGLASVCLYQPDLSLQVGQAAIAGVVLACGACLLEWLVIRRRGPTLHGRAYVGRERSAAQFTPPPSRLPQPSTTSPHPVEPVSKLESP